ncbi:class I SAM-dependent DNA methyltransferase [Ferrigenium sp. UT5]|uniref:class I SAM-dependent DNA methyltransferase n=1 Tax=Ferrigenium sp. UT5 TaxID=3242105 RepID=UPI00354B284E
MALSWNEIRNRAIEFSKRWENETSEDAEAKPFWTEFFNVFGIDRKRVASFEEPVKKLGDRQGYIDLFWKGMLLVEHKSRGKDLDKAYTQALDYFPGIKERDLPKYVLVSDFARFRLYDLEENTETEFKLADLHKRIKHFAFIAGYRTQTIAPQNPVNIKAAERMGKLHDALKAAGYEGHPLEVLLVRLLFCLFAEDTGIFQPASAFRAWIEERTAPDGSDLGAQLALLFQVLNTPETPPPQSSPASGRGSNRENHSSIPVRSKNLDEQLAAFPYVNGKLFEEMLPIADFDAALREALLDCCALDWSAISPAIFGALFQSIMDGKARRNLGAHYTSEENILKLIQPLFLDALWEEFKRVKSNKNKLFEFHKKLRTLTFFDPACGCGNFLVIAYRELRKLELDVLRTVHAGPGSRFLDIHQEISVDVDQFFGIEIEEFPAQIAQVALWLMDHQMNVRVSEEFGLYFARIPLKTSPHIVNGNALTLDWNDVLPAEQCSYVLGNPPFVGAKFMDEAQREDAQRVFADIKSGGLLDFVAAWYVKAARYITDASPFAGAGHARESHADTPVSVGARPARESVSHAGRAPTKAAFVSTNSITQGEQAGVLWGWLLARGMHIHFAHRTFQWSNEARGMAAVHCVIIGFYLPSPSGRGAGGEGEPKKTLYEYEDIRGEAHAVAARNINPYLVDAPDVVLVNRQHPICAVPEIGIGNKPIDGGHYLFAPDEKAEFLAHEPKAAKWFRRWIGADEFINGYERWCLWLGDCPPDELRRMPEAMKRVEAVRELRLASKSAPTQKLAATPTRFHVENIPDAPYLLIPRVSSERRSFIPIGFMHPDTLTSDTSLVISHATLYHFGILTSTMHMAWVRYTCGRLESRYRYSAGIVYNNFPWPDAVGAGPARESVSHAGRAPTNTVEAAAQTVLDVRAQFMLPSPSGGVGERVSAANSASLADLYDPLTMPPALVKAHQALDRAVDACYRKAPFTNDAQRVEFLFERYQQLTSLLPTATAKPKRSKKAAA